MKGLLIGLAVVPSLAGLAIAGQPALLNDSQLDQVTAGFTLSFPTGPLNSLTITIPGDPNCTMCVFVDFPSLDGLRGAPTVTIRQ
jgi:hypothetical protein